MQMAQTLNPYASAFQPTHDFEKHELDIERYLLPDSLLVSPRANYDSFSFSRCSPRGYSGSHLSNIPYTGDLDYLESASIPSVWEQYNHDRLLRYEMECDRRYRKLAETNPVYEPKQVVFNRRRNERPPFRPVERMTQTPPSTHRRPKPRQNPKFSTLAKQRVAAVPPQPQKIIKNSSVKFTPPPMNVPGDISPKYDAECLLHLVRSQLEFYFSDQNLYEEQHSNLQYYMKLDSQRFVPTHILLNLPSIAKLTTDKKVILDALRSSNLLELNDDETKCRRPNYVPPADYKVRKNLRRSVLVYGLPSQQMTDEPLRRLLGAHGNILCVAFAGMEEGPDPEISSVIMKKKFGDNVNLTNLTTAFVVFESQSQANKCVKTRSRHSVDGIRTMHKYDYNKVVKRLGKGQSPLITPSASPMPAKNQQCSNYGGMTPPVSGFQLNPNVNKPKQAMPYSRNNHKFTSINRNGFRKQWRNGSSKSDSLNWRGDNSMRPRTQSAQNSRPTYANKASKFQERRFSKENYQHENSLNHRNSFSLLNQL